MGVYQKQLDHQILNLLDEYHANDTQIQMAIIKNLQPKLKKQENEKVPLTLLSKVIGASGQIGQDLQEDPRLNVFKKEWFEGKECLDIGCNSGIIPFSLVAIS
ncbi:putative rna methyltransferase [Quercus suber]|uniref:RNA methyltransferase n=1 Tax=Quercus suber TaxID=58331 RepID=A0AAW0J1W4_QUESU